MKKYSYVTLILALGLFCNASPIFAQDNRESLTAEVNVNANVVQAIEMITVNTMRFGKVQPGQREIYINPVNNLNAGYMIAVGTPGAEFRLTYLPERQLTQIDGNGFLSFDYEISGNTEDNQATSEILENDNRDLRFNNEGRYYIWVGGRVNLENAPPGSYEGDFTIEIDYI